MQYLTVYFERADYLPSHISLNYSELTDDGYDGDSTK
jgi:hypothetical protein